MTARGIGYGKLLLFGEHAAVYGHPAIGVALTDSTTVSLTPSRCADAARWSSPHIPHAYRPYVDDLLSALESALQIDRPTLALEVIRGRVDIESTIPVAQGYGSSASLCVALAHAALAAVSTHKTGVTEVTPPLRVWSLANRLERLFHGRPSGIDTGLALRSGVTAFRFDGAELPRAVPLYGGSLILVAGALPRSGTTRQLITTIAERMQSGDGATAARLAELGELAAGAIELLPRVTDANGVELLGAMADRAHRALAQLGLETPRLRRCLQIARDCGSAGGKLSGAGGGGAFYAVFHDKHSAVRAARELIARREVDGATVRILAITDGQIRAVSPDTGRIAED